MKQKSKQYNATHMHIQDCFLQLLEGHAYESITVTSVSKQAGINRKTFYLHYTSLDALLEECTIRCVNAVTNRIVDALAQGVSDGKIATRAYAAFDENRTFWHWLLTRPDNEEAPYRCQRIAAQAMNDLQRTRFPNLTFQDNLPYVFTIYSLWMTLRLWVVWDNNDMSMQELSDQMDTFFTKGVTESLASVFEKYGNKQELGG